MEHLFPGSFKVIMTGAALVVICASFLLPRCRPADPPFRQDEIYRRVLRRQGDDNVHTYRIPALAATPTGTLIAVFDLRHKGSGDLPADIDVGMMRSADDGETWSKMQVILDFNAEEKESRGNGVGDPAVVVDRKTKQILVVALWSRGNHGWNGSGPGLTPEETGQLVITRSSDDGKTWSRATNITRNILGRDPGWRLCFNGPGAGIQLRDGTLVFAAQFRDAAGAPHSCFISSVDGGTMWRISPPAISTTPPTSEAQIAELADGSLLLSMRDESHSGKRAWARFTWEDGLSKGTWSNAWFTVPDPTCMASLIRHPNGMLLFSNPNSTSERIALTIRTSEDDGRTWSEGRLLDPRRSGYSCMTSLREGTIGILYECGGKSEIETLTYARFTQQWLEGKDKVR